MLFTRQCAHDRLHRSDDRAATIEPSIGGGSDFGLSVIEGNRENALPFVAVFWMLFGSLLSAGRCRQTDHEEQHEESNHRMIAFLKSAERSAVTDNK